MHLLLTTDAGLEALVADELREAEPGARGDRIASGLVLARSDAASDHATFEHRRLRLVHDVASLRADHRVATLDDVRAHASKLVLPELEAARSFRVTAHVDDTAPLERTAVAGAIGAALQRTHGTAVDLEAFEVNVRADLRGDRLILGVQLTREPLSARIRRARPLRTSLKATVAAAMVRLTGAHRGRGNFVDPTCGSGTIAIEAKSVHAALAVHASDRDAPTADCARATVRNHGLDIEVRTRDARALSRGWDRRFRFIASNPPHGHRLGRRVHLATFYGELMRSYVEALEESGRIVVLTPRRKALARAIEALPLTVVEEHVVRMGDLSPVMTLLEPR